MADQHDPVAGGNADDSHKTNESAERHSPPRQEHSGDAAEERKRQTCGEKRSETQGPELEPDEQQNAKEAKCAQEVELPLRLLKRGILAEELGVVALFELQRFDLFFNAFLSLLFPDTHYYQYKRGTKQTTFNQIKHPFGTSCS